MGPGFTVPEHTRMISPGWARLGWFGMVMVHFNDIVAPDALALERAQQVEKPGWAARFRAMKEARKAKK